jgi:hypothetical protein
MKCTQVGTYQLTPSYHVKEGAIEGAVVKKLQGHSKERFFLVANFRHLGTKIKRGDESNKENFENFFKSPYLEEKKLEVARFRQCVAVRRQN